MKTLYLSILISLAACFNLSAQHIAILDKERLEIRDLKGRYLASSWYSDALQAEAGNDIVVIRYANGRVEVRDINLRFISSQFFNGLDRISVAGDFIVLWFSNGKIEVRDRELRYESSWYL
jgi:hypothetical protein